MNDIMAVNTATLVERQEFIMEWKYKELIELLTEMLKKYQNLVVTEDNLKDMKSVDREITSLRTRLMAFGRDKKRELKAPIQQFEEELNSVLRVIAQVETPLKEQINEFENKAMLERKASVEKEIQLKAQSLGIREEYNAYIVPSAKWWENKTAKLADVTIAIDAMLKEVLNRQKTDDDFKQMQEEKKDMLEMKVEMFNQNYDLNTPIEFKEIYPKVSHLSLSDATTVIRNEFDKRMEIELATVEKLEESKNEEPMIAVVNDEQLEETKNVTFIVKNVTSKTLNEVIQALNELHVNYTVL